MFTMHGLHGQCALDTVADLGGGGWLCASIPG